MNLIHKKKIIKHKISHFENLSKCTRNIIIANVISLLLLIIASFFSSESFIYGYITSLSTGILVIMKYKIDIEIESLYLELQFLTDDQNIE